LIEDYPPGDVYPSIAPGRVERAIRRMHDRFTLEDLRSFGRTYGRDAVLKQTRFVGWSGDEWAAALWIMLQEAKTAPPVAQRKLRAS
jgi:hypothetical protein